MAQVPKNNKPLNPIGHKYFPTHQIIETKPSSHHRQEWGLKSSIPSKIKSRYLVFNDMDTLERLTTFEPHGASQWNRIRFKEMNLAPTYNMGKLNPLFGNESVVHDQAYTLSSLLNIDPELNSKGKITKLNSLKKLRAEFKSWLLERDPEALKNKKFSAKEMQSNVTDFLNERASSSGQINNHSQKMIGSGGLSYALPGKLKTSPRGVVSKTIVPGRCLNLNNDSKYTVAVGGFVTTALGDKLKNQNKNMDSSIRENVYPMEVQEASIDPNGRVNIKTDIILSHNQSTIMEIKSKTEYQMNPLWKKERRSSSRMVSDNAKQAADLLEMIMKGKDQK